MSKEDLLGTLVIVVLKARNLIDNHTFYKQDPYAKLSLSGEEKRTPVDQKGGQHPVWDHELRFPISKDSSYKNRTIEISCWSEERKDDQKLGEGKLDIKETLRSGEFDDWIKLDINGAQRGDIYLEMTFFKAGPSPLNRRPSKFHPNERLARPSQPNQPLPQQRISSGGLPAFSSNPDAPQLPSNKQSSPRPAQNQQSIPQSLRPTPAHQTSSGGQHLVPPGHSQGPNHSPPKDKDSALPPIPLADTGLKPVPTILRPGPRGGSRPVSDIFPAPSNSQYPDPRDYPSSPQPQLGFDGRPQPLAAGTGVTPATYHSPLGNSTSSGRPTSTYESPYSVPFTGLPGQITPPRTGYGSPPRAQHAPLPYTQPAHTAPYNSPYPSYPGASQQVNEPAAFAEGSGPNGFFFPVPNMPDFGSRSPSAAPAGGEYVPYPGARPNPPASSSADRDSDLPDPYLQKRYQTPLPLPSSPPLHPQSRPHSHSNSYSSATAPASAPPAGFAIADSQHRAPQEYGHRMPEPGISADERAAREAQQAEEESVRRQKEQEELDEKLARELDMQLNMDERPPDAPRPSGGVGMPGGW